jgi:hypothetical protein
MGRKSGVTMRHPRTPIGTRRIFSVPAPPIQEVWSLLSDEKKKELMEKLGVTEEEFAGLVKRKSDEKNVTPNGAKLLLYYEAFNKPKGVETNLENFSKPKEDMANLFDEASSYLSQYAAVNHKNEPDWIESQLVLEMKHDKNYSPEKATMLLAYAYGWRDGKPLSMFDSKCQTIPRLDALSLDGLLSKINDFGRITFLTGRVNRISNAREDEGAYRLRSTGIELTDGKDKVWVNCHDTKPFTSKKSGKLVAGKFLSTKAQMNRTDMIGSIATFMNLDTRITKKGDLRLNTGPYSNFNYEKTEQNEKSPLEGDS